MLTSVRLPHRVGLTKWEVSEWTGALSMRERRGSSVGPPSQTIPAQPLAAALANCSDPFTCAWNPVPDDFSVSVREERVLSSLHARLSFFCRSHFRAAILYAGLFRPMFDTTRQAFSQISLIPDQQRNRDTLCL